MAKKKAAQKAVKQVQPVKEDRSAFNCPVCHGEGLKPNFPHLLCPQCAGTGKV